MSESGFGINNSQVISEGFDQFYNELFNKHDFADEEIDIERFIEDHKKQTYEELKDDPRFIEWKDETD